MNAQAALQVLLAAGMSLMGGAPIALVLLQLVGNLSRQITPGDVRDAVKILEKAGSFAEARLLEGLHAFAHGSNSPWGPADTGGNVPASSDAIVLDQKPETEPGA